MKIQKIEAGQWHIANVVCDDSVMAQVLACDPRYPQGLPTVEKHRAAIARTRKDRRTHNPFQWVFSNGNKLNIEHGVRGGFQLQYYNNHGKDGEDAANELRALYALREASRFYQLSCDRGFGPQPVLVFTISYPYPKEGV